MQRTGHTTVPFVLGLGARHRGLVELSARIVLESDWSDSARAVLVTLSRDIDFEFLLYGVRPKVSTSAHAAAHAQP